MAVVCAAQTLGSMDHTRLDDLRVNDPVLSFEGPIVDVRPSISEDHFNVLRSNKFIFCKQHFVELTNSN